jgi:2-C-methyl-D-erythritol 2,4-cyclodiphosphate synthase
MLGGVCVSEVVGCVAHSDGDCLLHALMDAMLGALALPNIGVLFPDSDARNRGRSSTEMLAHVAEIVDNEGYGIVNVDLVILLETPKLNPFIEKIAASIAKSLAVDRHMVGLKATTAETVGPIGASEAIEAMAVCLLGRRHTAT